MGGRARFLLVLLALAVSFLSIAGAASAATPKFSQSELESELMCPTCGEALEMSQAPVADRIRAFIAAKQADGWTKKQTKDALVAQFGNQILATPPNDASGNAIWAIPVIGLLIGVAASLVALRRRRRRALPREAVVEDVLEPEEDDRVSTALARYEDAAS